MKDEEGNEKLIRVERCKEGRGRNGGWISFMNDEKGNEKLSMLSIGGAGASGDGGGGANILAECPSRNLSDIQSSHQLLCNNKVYALEPY